MTQTTQLVTINELRLLPSSPLEHLKPERDPLVEDWTDWSANIVHFGRALRTFAPCGCFETIGISVGEGGRRELSERDRMLTPCGKPDTCQFDWQLSQQAADELMEQTE